MHAYTSSARIIGYSNEKVSHAVGCVQAMDGCVVHRFQMRQHTAMQLPSTSKEALCT